MIVDMPAQYYVTEGVAATFPCYVSGQPTPWVYWYLNNRYSFTKQVVMRILGPRNERPYDRAWGMLTKEIQELTYLLTMYVCPYASM